MSLFVVGLYLNLHTILVVEDTVPNTLIDGDPERTA